MRGTRLRVRVLPGAASSGVAGRHGDAWKLRVRQPPEHGRANDAILALLARLLDLPPRSLRIVSGHASRDKVVELDGVGQHEAERRLSGGKSA